MRLNKSTAVIYVSQLYLFLLINKGCYTIWTRHGSSLALNDLVLLQVALSHRLLALRARRSGKLTLVQMTLEGKQHIETMK